MVQSCGKYKKDQKTNNGEFQSDPANVGRQSGKSSPRFDQTVEEN